MLYIVSTPIGNLGDITFRAVEILKNVQLIAAEDTRHTKILLDKYEIKTPMTSYFEHNEFKKSEVILKALKEGRDIALVTDAGTPGISDPGYKLIKLAKENSIPITVIPGPAALIAALNLSGFPSDSFIFEGFMPVKCGARQKLLDSFKEEWRTIIFYESPHRIDETMADIQECLPDFNVVIAREITKKFEEVLSGKPAELSAIIKNHKLKGEIVILLNKGK